MSCWPPPFSPPLEATVTTVNQIPGSFAVQGAGGPPETTTEAMPGLLPKSLALSECHSGMWKNATCPPCQLHQLPVSCANIFSLLCPAWAVGNVTAARHPSCVSTRRCALSSLIPGAVWLLSRMPLQKTYCISCCTLALIDLKKVSWLALSHHRTIPTKLAVLLIIFPSAFVCKQKATSKYSNLHPHFTQESVEFKRYIWTSI